MTFHLREEPEVAGLVLSSSDKIVLRHLKSARVRKGEGIRLIFRNRIYDCQLGERTKGGFSARILASFEVAYRKPTLYFALSALSGTKLGEIVFALSQLLVDEFWIFGARRSEKVKLQPRLLERLTEISIRACEISGILHLPAFRLLKDTSEVIRQAESLAGEPTRKLLFYEEVTERSVPISAFLRQPYCRSKVVAVIGPEGGFEDEEVQDLAKAGFELLSLGKVVLDSRVAAYYACSAICLWMGLLEDRWGFLRSTK